MGHIYETHSVTIETTHEKFSFVVGLKDLDGQTINRILYDSESKQLQIETTGETISLNARQSHFKVNDHTVHCAIRVGSLVREYKPTLAKRPSPPPPLKRRPPTGYYNPITGESFQAEQLYNQAELKRKESELENLKNQLKAEKSNLEKQLDSMWKAYQAEELENRNLRQQLVEATGDLPSGASDSRQIIEYNYQLENKVNHYQHRAGELYNHNRHLMRQINEEKQVSGVLHEETRLKFMAWGVGLTTYQIVDLLFRFLA